MTSGQVRRYLEGDVGHSFGQIVRLQTVPVVQMFSEEHSHLQRNCGHKNPSANGRCVWWCGPTGGLTCEHSGHQSGEHQEQHGEEEEPRVAENLFGFVADVQVQQADQNADTDVRGNPQMSQHLVDQ